MMPRPYDVIIVGGGPAGLSAALVLVRCLRRVLVIDAGHPRNYASRSAHNYLTRDGIHPREFLEVARREVECHGVEVRQGVVSHAEPTNPGFVVDLVDGESFACRKMLLATGVRDVLPPIRNIEAFYGLGVHHCPYCDGFEYAGKPLAAVGEPKKAVGLAMSLRTWSPMVTGCSNGAPFSKTLVRQAQRLGIALRAERIESLEAVAEGAAGERVFMQPAQEVAVERGTVQRLGRVCFRDGPPLEVAGLFFNTAQVQRSDLAEKLGCGYNAAGGIDRDGRQRTCIEDLYIAGDASRDVQFLIVAAAEGARAGVAINTDFQRAAQGLARAWPTGRLEGKVEAGEGATIPEKKLTTPKGAEPSPPPAPGGGASRGG